MTRFKWLKMRKKTQPELPLEPPIWLGPQSNGEYFLPATERDRKLRRFILEKCDENARKLGMDRREFLASAMATITAYWCIDQATGCSSDNSGSTGGKSDKDANLCKIPEAMLDESRACQAVGGNEFIFDVQTHWFKREDLDRFPLYRDLFARIFDRATENEYITQMFCGAGYTTVAALTAWPGVSCESGAETCGLPLSNASMAASRDRINQLALNTQRVVQHVQLMPQDGIESQLAIMEQMCLSAGVAAWKLYPGFGGGFYMDDPGGRQIIQKGIELGLPLFCVHKGLQIGGFFNATHNHPRDIGPVAKDYPNANFVIYHSAICALSEPLRDGTLTGAPINDCLAPYTTEGPYDPNDPHPNGLNSLIKSLADVGIGPEPGQTPNKNVYGEVGSAINRVMTDTATAAHFFGKLMKYLGTDYVVWGTDCIVYPSPDPFIEWFRTLEIPQSMQEEYGYPPLNAENKAKIFGLNAARLYGIDPAETRCHVEQCASAQLQRQLDDELGPNRFAFLPPGGPKTYEEFVQDYKRALAFGRPG